MPDCQISGPYHPVGDIDWVCLTHGDVVCVVRDEWLHDGEKFIARYMLRCPVAEPQPGDPPLAYENRSPGGARNA